MKEFLISVVVPVYNTEKYLRETIESVINQSIGFEENIQLILVNNVTQDNSEEICLEYLGLYPNNVEYICVEENHGPCSARNAGQKVAVGKYINFLDSDDKWEPDAFEHAINFFEEHYDEIDIVSCRMQHFDAFSDYDLFDFKYNKGSRVVNIEREPECVLFGLCSSIIKREVAVLFQHDERIRHAEDMKYLTEIMFRTFRYGLVREGKFRYRARLEQNSTLNTTSGSDNWYKETIEYAYYYLMSLSIDKVGYVIPYLQNILMSEVRGRLEKDVPDKYDTEFIQAYKNSLTGILKNIDDKLIVEETHLTVERKIHALNLKYGEEIYNWLKNNDETIVFKEWDLFNINELIKFRTITVIEDHIIITGFYRSTIAMDIEKMEVRDENGDLCRIETKALDKRNVLRCLNEDVCQGRTFYLSVPFYVGRKLKFYLCCNNRKVLQRISLLDMHSCNEVSFRIEDNAISVVEENKNLYPTYYLFPFESIEKGSSIYLYGAGYIGRQYLEQILLSNYCNVLGVADRNFRNIENMSGIEVVDPRIMSENKFDKVVIAIGKREIVANVIENLNNLGIERSKMVVATERSIPWY